MIILPHEQGSAEWERARLGRATASNFKKIMQPKKLKPSVTTYLYELAAERTTGEKQEREWTNYYVERGKELEPTAVLSYEFVKNEEVKRVGFCLGYEKAAFGCSPDGLVGDDGGLEIKCPMLAQHIQYCEENVLPDDYKSQVYGCLFVTQRKWWDFMSYHPDYEDFTIRVCAEDEDYKKWAEAFKPILTDFLKKLSKISKDEIHHLEEKKQC